MLRTYNQLIRLPTFKERYEYLRLKGSVGESTFGVHRYVNQALYNSYEWNQVRDQVIVRDNGCDLGHPDFQIYDRIYVHHINPITLDDIECAKPAVFDPRNLICTSFSTHQAIHFGDEALLPPEPIVRYPNDMCPWKGVT